MLTCCNTARGRVACGLGGVLIAVLALACLWAFSPSVTAGDDPLLPPKERVEPGKKTTCPDPGLPLMPAEDKTGPVPAAPPRGPEADLVYQQARQAEQAANWPEAIRKYTRLGDLFRDGDNKLSMQYFNRADWLKQRHPAPPSLPPVETGGALPPPLSLGSGDVHISGPPTVGTDKAPAPLLPVDTPPLPEGPIAPVAGVGTVTPPPPQAQPPADTQDVKQLVAHLSEIRADRAKLDEKERQTIQTIKRKYQDQKRALEQLDRELRQLGINCDETPPEKAPLPPPLPR